MSDSMAPCPTQDQEGVWRDAAGRRCCGAKNRDGSRCRVWLGLGAGHRCKRHGGRSLHGPASPSWKHGASSSFLPRKFRRFYLAWEARPDRMSLIREIGAVESRLLERFQTLKGGNPVSARDIVVALEQFKVSMRTKDPAMIQRAFERLEGSIRANGDEEGAWREIFAMQERKARLIEAETKRALTAQSMISAAEAFAIIGVVADLVRTHVPDPSVRRAIADGLHRLTGRSLVH